MSCSHEAEFPSISGQGPHFTMIDEEVESQAHRCNKKKKSAKTVEVRSPSSCTHTLTVTVYSSGAKHADVLCHIHKGESTCKDGCIVLCSIVCGT